MATNVTYGDVTLTNVNTLAFDQSVKYDDSGSDLLYHEFTIRVECVAHSSAATLIHGFPGASAVAAEIELQNRLTQPRKAFEYKVGDQVLVAANNNNASPDFDLRSGPHPTSCKITHLAGSKSIRIIFEINISILKGSAPSPGELDPRASSAGLMPGVLNNRWTAEESFDENLYLSRTIEGKLRVKHIGLNPQVYRLLAIPKLAVGFKRMRASFTTSTDGLELRYSLTDRQLAAAPPFPATTWSATYTETTTDNGAITIGEVAVQMEGPPNADKRALLERCQQVVLQRLPDLRTNIGGGESSRRGRDIIISSSATESLHKNAVEVRVRVQHTISPRRIMAMILEHFGRPLSLPDYTPKTQVIPAQFDAATPTGIFSMYLQTPYDDFHGLLPADTGTDTPASPAQYFQESPASPGESPGETEGEDGSANVKKGSEVPVSDDQKDDPIIIYESTDVTETDEGTAQLAISSDLDTGTEGSASEPVKIYNSVSRRTMYFYAERIGSPPEWPTTPKTFTDNGTVYERAVDKITNLGVQPHVSGEDVFRQKKTVVYYVVKSPTELDKLTPLENKQLDSAAQGSTLDDLLPASVTNFDNRTNLSAPDFLDT